MQKKSTKGKEVVFFERGHGTTEPRQSMMILQ